MRILYSGGGSMGPVTPLLAIHEQLQAEPDYVPLWVGTRQGPERGAIEHLSIPFKTIPSGKLRRYFDWRNFTDPFLVIAGYFKSLWIVWRFKPDVVLTAGGFVCVPLVYAAWMFKRPIIVHQMDVRVGLANTLMVPVATRVTVALDELRHQFPRSKVVVTGNPMRLGLFSGNADRGRERFKLEHNLPTVLVMCGGLGSAAINQIVVQAARDLVQFCQVLLVTGAAEYSQWANHPLIDRQSRIHVFPFLKDELADAFAVADLVVCRAGFATLTELAGLQKAAVVIPIPNHQQVDNAVYFQKRQAIIYAQQDDVDPEYLVNLLKDLFSRPQRLELLRANIAHVMPGNATQEYVNVVKQIAK